jgi:uncharacterized protein (PEP-CTERM system associated)
MAFPATDQSNPPLVPTGADLAAPDVQDLQHQMGLASGFAGLGTEGGWTILPRVTAEEQLTDNVFEVRSPRQWDLTTVLSPGIAVLGDTSRVQLRLNYAPTLEIHVEAGNQNVLAQQLAAVGTVTFIPDLFFVDVRALAGVQATNGGLGGLGGLGQPGAGPVTASSVASQTEQGLSKENRAQTTVVSISPYLLDRFGDFGTAKVGLSLTQSSTSQLKGFAPIPLVSQGTNSESQTGLEEYGQVQTGDQFTVFRDTASLDLRQTTASGTGSNYSSRETANNRVDYEISRSIDIYGEAGWENISFSGANAVHINGPTWGVGTVLTPNADSQLTVGYGRHDGGDSFNFSGRYAVTPRTTLTGSFNNGVGTQLDQLGSQLGQSGVASDGSLVNSETGGPLFVGNNALGISGGVFRFNYLSFNATTILDRDEVALTVAHSEEMQIGRGTTGTSNAVWTGTVSWTRQFTADLKGTATVSYSLGSPTAGEHSNSLLASVGLQYILSETVSTFVRYSFYDRQSDIAGLSFYQDLVLVGITKQF